MRLARPLKWALVGAVLVAAGGVALLVSTLPPRARPTLAAADAFDVAPGRVAHVVRGAYHVHTTRSDGSGTMEEAAAAAARAGLQFVLFTDHGDGTRAKLPPAYHAGVLCIDGVEISTSGGHYVALDLPQTPYRLAGNPADVVEDVARFGGFGIAAHPDSPKSELAWARWDLPIDGVEWLNLDTEWRDESHARIVWGLVQHLLRPAAAVASLIGHSPAVLERWDALARDRRVVAVAALDAHARFAIENGFNRDNTLVLRVPSYETSFRTIHLNVQLSQPLTGRAAEDARAVVDGVRAGRVYSSIDALAAAGRVDFTAQSAGSPASGMGGFLVPADVIVLSAAADAPAGARLRLVCDGRTVRDERADRRVTHELRGSSPATCRLEVGWLEGARFARWIVTNPIYLRGADLVRGPVPSPPLTESDTFGNPVRGAAWLVEHDPGSTATLQSTGARLQQIVSMAYTLRAGRRASQYAALATPDVEALARSSHVAFSIRADRPTRISVQVREPRPDGEARRWTRSIYADSTRREVTLALDDLVPVAPTRDRHPRPGALRGLLFVIDTEHTVPGVSGTVWVEHLRAGRP